MTGHEDSAALPKGIVPKLLLRLLFSLALSLLLLLTAAFFVSGGTLPGSVMHGAPILAAAVGAFYAGFTAFRCLKSRALVIGLAAGLIYFLLLFVLGALFFSHWGSGDSTLVVLLVSLGTAALGAVLAASGKKKRHS